MTSNDAEKSNVQQKHNKDDYMFIEVWGENSLGLSNKIKAFLKAKNCFVEKTDSIAMTADELKMTFVIKIETSTIKNVNQLARIIEGIDEVESARDIKSLMGDSFFM